MGSPVHNPGSLAFRIPMRACPPFCVERVGPRTSALTLSALPQPVHFPGLRERCTDAPRKQYIFRSCNTYIFSVMRFDENPFTCQCQNKQTNKNILKKQTKIRLKGFRFRPHTLTVVFKRHHGSERVNTCTPLSLYVYASLCLCLSLPLSLPLPLPPLAGFWKFYLPQDHTMMIMMCVHRGPPDHLRTSLRSSLVLTKRGHNITPSAEIALFDRQRRCPYQ